MPSSDQARRHSALQRIAQLIRNLIGKKKAPKDPEPPEDPYAYVTAPKKPRPPYRSAAAVAERPEE